jgi:hypothetical protein
MEKAEEEDDTPDAPPCKKQKFVKPVIKVNTKKTALAKKLRKL